MHRRCFKDEGHFTGTTDFEGFLFPHIFECHALGVVSTVSVAVFVASFFPSSIACSVRRASHRRGVINQGSIMRVLHQRDSLLRY